SQADPEFGELLDPLAQVSDRRAGQKTHFPLREPGPSRGKKRIRNASRDRGILGHFGFSLFVHWSIQEVRLMASQRSLKIMILVDMIIPPPEEHQYDDLLKTEEWKNEAHLM